MGWGLAYVALVLALVVRIANPDVVSRDLPAPSPTEPLRLVTIHHAVFYALLFVASPLEALLFGGAEHWRWAGLTAFALGVAAYRVAGQHLGEALSPFVEPAPGGHLVTHGVYGAVRHPMYLGQGLIAFGAPLTLGCRYTLALGAVAVIVLLVRMRVEEVALRRTYPEYTAYAAHAKRIVPFLF